MAAWSMLKRSKRLRRNKPLRSKPAVSGGWKYDRKKRRGFPPHVKMAIYARDEGICQVCGKWGDPTTHNAHHIHTAGQQGPDTAENGMWVCEIRWDKLPCHAKIHKYPEWSYKNGYMVRGVGIVGKTVNTFPREG